MSTGNPFPGGTIGSGKGGNAAKPKADKPAKAPKAKAEKAPKPPKEPKAPKEGGIVRKPSTVPTEGEAVCAFDGKSYPLKKFATVRDSKTGEYVRGTVARHNLPAWRKQNAAQREAEKAGKAEAKKAAADKKAADKTAAAKAKADAKAAKEKASADA